MIFTVILSFLKTFINNVIAFFSTKVGQIILVILLALGALWFSHSKGFDSGVKKERAEATKEYNIKLSKALAKAKEDQDIAVKNARETAKKEIQIVTVYKEKIVEVEKIKNNPKIKDCVLPTEDFKKLNKILDDIK